jgi:hypothetical protein
MRQVSAAMTHQFVRIADEHTRGWRLDEIELSFSLELEAEAGVVLAKAKTSTGFEVSLKWSREES